MKITPIKTYIAAALIAAAPLTKATAQYRKCSPFNDTKALISLVAQGGVAQKAPTYAIGFNAPNMFSIKVNGNRLMRNHIDFFGILWKQQKYTDKIKENIQLKGSLVSTELLPYKRNGRNVSLKLADTYTCTAGDMATPPMPQGASKLPPKENQIEISNLIGPMVSVKLGENTTLKATGGLLNSNKQTTTFGYMTSLISNFSENFQGFIKAEKASSTGTNVNAGLMYKL